MFSNKTNVIFLLIVLLFTGCVSAPAVKTQTYPQNGIGVSIKKGSSIRLTF